MDEYQEIVNRLEKVLDVKHPAPEAAAVPCAWDDDSSVDKLRLLKQTFDVGEVFGALKRLRMEAGYVLDYVYEDDGIGGQPVLYARPVQASPLSSLEQLPSLPEDCREFPFHVEVTDSPLGFFELQMLRLKGDNFFLFWHAYYVFVTVLCDPTIIAEKMRDSSYGAYVPDGASELPLAPRIEVSPESVTVSVVVEDYNRDLSLLETTFRVLPPHLVVAESERKVLGHLVTIVF